VLGQVAAFFAIFCALVLLPAVLLGWSVATKWLDLQQEMLQLEREKVRLLSDQARLESSRAATTSAYSAPVPAPLGGPTVRDS